MQSTLAAKLFGDREDPRKRLQSLFGGDLSAAGQPPEPALVWARSMLRGTQADSPRDVVIATSQLREAEPRLTLKAATFLATHAIGWGESV